jgi:hypothetical protein
MAVQIVAQVVAQIVGNAGGDPTDVESDSTAAGQGTVNVHIPPQAGSRGFITLEPLPASVIAAIANGACTVTISQGAGTLNTAVTA